MSAKFYQAALAAVRRAEKAAYDRPDSHDLSADDKERIVQMEIDAFMASHKRALALCEQMHKAVPKAPKVDTFFLTIAPRHDAALWPAFREQVHKWCKGKAWDFCAYVFEQKGTSDDTLGSQFHTHIVGRSLLPHAALLQRAKSAFKSFAAPQAIKLEHAVTPAKVWARYLKAHTSNDGHKQVTAAWDAKWREQQHLLPAYGAVDHPLFAEDDMEDGHEGGSRA